MPSLHDYALMADPERIREVVITGRNQSGNVTLFDAYLIGAMATYLPIGLVEAITENARDYSLNI